MQVLGAEGTSAGRALTCSLLTKHTQPVSSIAAELYYARGLGYDTLTNESLKTNKKEKEKKFVFRELDGNESLSREELARPLKLKLFSQPNMDFFFFPSWGFIL